MLNIDRAIILAAGEGRRLRPLTAALPKCLVAVDSTPMLINALSNLAQTGCVEVTIVIGYLAGVLQAEVGDRCFGMTINYVLNEQYATTNSMYSLKMGLDATPAPCWIIEGDIMFEQSILALRGYQAINWYVDSSTRTLDGSYVKSSSGKAVSVDIVRDLTILELAHSKSIGILGVTRAGRSMLLSWLNEGIRAGQEDKYYDVIIGSQLSQTDDVGSVDVEGKRWFEVDTVSDLLEASNIFRKI